MKNIFLSLLFVMFCLMPVYADDYACGNNSYDPQIGTFDPSEHYLYEFVEGAEYALVFHKDEYGSYVLATKEGVVEEGVKLVIRQYVEGDKSMLFTAVPVGDGTYFLKSAANPDLAITGGGNLTDATLQEFENVVDLGAQMWALSYCDMSEFQDGDAYTMYNVYYGTGMDTDNQLVEENWRVIFWKNFGAWHPVNIAEPDYEFKKPKEWVRPANATFIKENLDTSKKYAIIWRWFKDEEPLFAYNDGAITGKALKATEGGSTIEPYQKSDEFLFTAEKVGDYFKFRNAANGKVLSSAGTNMSGVLLIDEASLSNPDEALWDVKDVNEDGVYGLAFSLVSKAGGKAIDVANQETADGTQVLIWDLGREWFIFDADIDQDPFADLSTGLPNVVAAQNYVKYGNGKLTVCSADVQELQIYGVLGNVIKRIEDVNAGDVVELSDLQSGIYVVKILLPNAKQNVSQKIIVQ